jgi:hypothetical protein
MPRQAAGLCDSCVHQQLVHTTRGSTFSLCKRSKTEPEFAKYPRLPVLRCRGHELRR